MYSLESYPRTAEDAKDPWREPAALTMLPSLQSIWLCSVVLSSYIDIGDSQ